MLPIVSLLIGAAGLGLAVWGLIRTRRRERAEGLEAAVSDGTLQLLRMLVKFGYVREFEYRPDGADWTRGTFMIGPILVARDDPQNEWIPHTFYSMENEGLIEGSEKGLWPTPGPRQAWITDSGRKLVRLNAKRKIREKRIVIGSPPFVEQRKRP